MAKSVKISFQPITTPIDSAHNGVKINKYTFKGAYFNCVSLIDSISKTQGIGRITYLRLSSTPVDDQHSDGKLFVELGMVALEY